MGINLYCFVKKSKLSKIREGILTAGVYIFLIMVGIWTVSGGYFEIQNEGTDSQCTFKAENFDISMSASEKNTWRFIKLFLKVIFNLIEKSTLLSFYFNVPSLVFRLTHLNFIFSVVSEPLTPLLSLDNNNNNKFRNSTKLQKMTDQPKHKPPHGMEPYDLGGGDDLGALSKEQQQKLNDFKVNFYRLSIIFFLSCIICQALDGAL